MTTEWCAIVLDVSADMCAATRRAAGTVDEGKKAAQQLLISKMLFSKKDAVFVALVGTPDSENDLHGGDDTQCRNVVSLTPDFALPTPDLVRSIGGVPDYTGVSDARGDVLDAIVLALYSLGRIPKYKRGCGRIVVITCGDGVVTDAEQEQAINAQMAALGVKMDLFAVGFDADTPKSMLLKSMCDAQGGYFIPVATALDLMSALRSASVKQVTKFRGELDIAGVVGIPLHAFSYTYAAKTPSNKRMPSRLVGDAASAAAAATTEEGAGAAAGDEEDAGDAPSASSSGVGVKFDRRYHRRPAGEADEAAVGEEVPATELIKTYNYGKDTVILTAESDAALLEYKQERSLQMIAFTGVAGIPRYAVMGSTDVLVPAPGDARAAAAFTALVHAMIRQRVVMLVRFIKRKGSAPSLGALLPGLPSEEELAAMGGADTPEALAYLQNWVVAPSSPPVTCMYFVTLPFMDDIRPFAFNAFEADEKFAPTQAQLDATDALITALDLTAVPAPKGGGTFEACLPTQMFNPVHARYYSALAARILDENASLPPLNPAVDAYMRPNKELMAAAEKQLAAYRAAVGPVLKRNPKTELLAGRRLYNEQLSGSDGPALPAGRKRARGVVADASSTGDAVKKPREGDGEAGDGMSVDALFRSEAGRVDRVGTVRPMEDFKSMLERRDRDLVRPAVLGMSGVIKTLVAEPDLTEKARDCLAELRVGCVANAVEGMFNDILMELKSEHGPTASRRHGDDFWQRVVNAGISLISESESANVSVTDEQKMAFLAGWSEGGAGQASQSMRPSMTSLAMPDMDDIE